jgi:hypothetical protein
VGFHENRFIKPSFAGASSNPAIGGVTIETPHGGNLALKGGKGVIETRVSDFVMTLTVMIKTVFSFGLSL